MSTKGYQIIHPLLREKVNKLEKCTQKFNEIIRNTIRQQQETKDQLLKLHQKFSDIPGVFDRKEHMTDIVLLYMEEFKLKYDFGLTDFAHVNKMLEWMLSTLERRERLWTTYLETLRVVYDIAERIISYMESENVAPEIISFGKRIILQGCELMEKDSGVLLEEKSYRIELWQEEKLEFQLDTAKKLEESIRKMV